MVEFLRLGRGTLEAVCSKNVPAGYIFIAEPLKLQSSTEICNFKWGLAICIYTYPSEVVGTPGFGVPRQLKKAAVDREGLYPPEITAVPSRVWPPGKLVGPSLFSLAQWAPGAVPTVLLSVPLYQGPGTTPGADGAVHTQEPREEKIG